MILNETFFLLLNTNTNRKRMMSSVIFSRLPGYMLRADKVSIALAVMAATSFGGAVFGMSSGLYSVARGNDSIYGDELTDVVVSTAHGYVAGSIWPLWLPIWGFTQIAMVQAT